MKKVEKKSGKQRLKNAELGTENHGTHDRLNGASFRGPQDAVLSDVEPKTLNAEPKTLVLGGSNFAFLITLK